VQRGGCGFVARGDNSRAGDWNFFPNPHQRLPPFGRMDVAGSGVWCTNTPA